MRPPLSSLRPIRMSPVADASLPTITVEHAIALMEAAAKAPATAQATREERIFMAISPYID